MDSFVSKIFEVRPEQWGLRGDPYLWDDMEEFFSRYTIPFLEERFVEEFLSTYEMFTGKPLDNQDNIYIAEYSHGGMSSGRIDPSFWKEKALPLLLKRLIKLNVEDMK